MMLPFEMLADKSIRKEVCPTLSTPLITRVVCSFVPDEFSPNPIPNSLIEALDAEMQDDDIEAYEGSLINFPCTAPPSAYKPPPSNSFSAIIARAQSLRRSSSSMLKKSYTSDDELDELDSPLTSILADSSRVSSSSDGIQWFPKGGRSIVCPTLSTPLITRVVCSFVPDEFSPNPIPNLLIEALDAEMQDDDIEAYEGSLINFPCTAPPSAYKPPPSNSFSAIIAGAQSLRRSSSSMLKKSYTSDDELDELDSPLTSILADSSQVSSSSDGIQWFPKGGRSIVRYQLLREVRKDSE
nr:hypothetical protein [Tanacetum cinerariifolium]